MLIWVILFIVLFFLLGLDLFVFNKTDHEVSSKESGKLTLFWVAIALLFSPCIFFIYKNGWIDNVENLSPIKATLKYITGYLIELSLSVDNIFVIALIFTSFKIPNMYQHRVLFWGIIGAIVFRLIAILFGVSLINQFHWIIYVFGIFLIYTAINMLLDKGDDEYEPEKTWVFRNLKKLMPVTKHIRNNQFFIRKGGILFATPLFVALIIVEFTDIMFALDSIPAILAVTTDPFLVFSSNIFAILGLRSIYFLLANMLDRFQYLKYSLVAILTFVGVKMLLSSYIHFPEWFSLGFIALSLGMGIFVSLRKS